ncbi:MAG: hypothetical protein KDA66_18555, partial [Planctomycetaceae bacterium]|nr:hypothetical protein [Planctomycetaceae bacterium]
INFMVSIAVIAFRHQIGSESEDALNTVPVELKDGATFWFSENLGWYLNHAVLMTVLLFGGVLVLAIAFGFWKWTTGTPLTESITPPPPLPPNELLSLRRWHHRNVASFLAVLLGWPIAAVVLKIAEFCFEIPRQFLEPVVLCTFLASILLAIGHHLSKRCPRCGAIIGLRTQIGLPPHCPRCGVSFVAEQGDPSGQAASPNESP